jgi:hypothetical protein
MMSPRLHETSLDLKSEISAVPPHTKPNVVMIEEFFEKLFENHRSSGRFSVAIGIFDMLD